MNKVYKAKAKFVCDLSGALKRATAKRVQEAREKAAQDPMKKH